MSSPTHLVLKTESEPNTFHHTYNSGIERKITTRKGPKEGRPESKVESRTSALSPARHEVNTRKSWRA